MRLRHVATTAAALTATVAAGLTTATVLRERTERRASAGEAAPAPRLSHVRAVDGAGVVLPFTRPPAPVPEASGTAARCGDNGGLTKAGARCAARATTGGRCHHHRLAA